MRNPTVHHATVFLAYMACVLEGADEAVIPAFYSGSGQFLGASPFTLGILLLFRVLVQAISFPLVSILALSYDRGILIGAGTLWCGLFALGAGFCASYFSIAIVRALSGIGLALIVPSIQSVIAECHKEQERGLSFGWMYASLKMGGIAGGSFTALLASQVYSTVPGWKIAFYLIGFLSISCGLLFFACDEDPLTASPKIEKYNTFAGTLSSHVSQVSVQLYRVSGIRTFQVLMIQGIIGQAPWFAVSLLHLWFLLCGYSRATAFLLINILEIGTVFGSIFGGMLGDIASLKNPTVGRILCAQFSAGVVIPMSAILLEGFSRPADHILIFGLTIFLMGFLMSWIPPACNLPVLSEVVPVSLRTSLFSLDMLIQKSFIAVNAPLLGFIVEGIHRSTNHVLNVGREQDDVGIALEAVDDVAKNIFVAIAFPSFVSVTLIFGLYWTYSSDRDRARVESWVDRTAEFVDRETESETSSQRRDWKLQIVDDWLSDEDFSQFQENAAESPPVSVQELEQRGELSTGGNPNTQSSSRELEGESLIDHDWEKLTLLKQSSTTDKSRW